MMLRLLFQELPRQIGKKHPERLEVEQWFRKRLCTDDEIFRLEMTYGDVDMETTVFLTKYSMHDIMDEWDRYNML